MLNVIKRYYHTLRFLQWTQIKYRLIYQLWPYRSGFKKKDHNIPKHQQLILLESIPSKASWFGDQTFSFLNIKHRFEKKIDWNYQEHGKLWTYNLSYFEFLLQPNLSKEEGLDLIHHFIDQQENIKDGMEQFPISLRGVFWIKFLIKHQIQEKKIIHSLFQQFQFLSRKPEYHLLGNHLLENGFSLLFGAYYFDDKPLLKLAKRILNEQLKEQILEDGAHFELSPMYHQIMLFRLLDSINLLQHNPKASEQKILVLMKEKAAMMLGWLDQITFRNGDIPLVNDSTNHIAPDSKSLLEYAFRLGIKFKKKPLKESGYRKVETPNYELLIDVGDIGPDYIPGHAHSDTFNFILHHKNQPILVDMGISTYEKNARRNIERSTRSHNTVMIDGLEQSEVWGGFRVAKRAKIIRFEASDNQLLAAHDGYRQINCEHQRSFVFSNQSFTIQDEIIGEGKATAFFHFHSSVDPQLNGNMITGTFGNICFKDFDHIRLEPYSLAVGFNQTQDATKVVVNFRKHLSTKFNLK